MCLRLFQPARLKACDRKPKVPLGVHTLQVSCGGPIHHDSANIAAICVGAL